MLHLLLRLHKDDHLARLLRLMDLLQDRLQLVLLLKVLAHLHDLVDAVIRRQLQRPDVHLNIIGAEEVLRQASHLLRPRRTPHEHLAVGTDLRDDLSDLRLEAHVQHAVRLVQHEVRAPPQVRLARLEEVDEAAGRGNHDLTAALQIPGLVVPWSATEHAGVSHVRHRPEIGRHLLDLLRQFTGGRQDQSDGSVSALQRRLVVDVHDGGQDEAAGLAGASLSDGHHVRAAEGDGPALALNRCRLLVVLTTHLLHDVVGETRLLEGLDGVGSVADDRDLVLLAVAVDFVGGSFGGDGVHLVEVLLERLQLRHVPLGRVQLDGVAELSASHATAAAATTPETATGRGFEHASVPHAAAAATTRPTSIASATTSTASVTGTVATTTAAATASVLTVTVTTTAAAMQRCPE